MPSKLQTFVQLSEETTLRLTKDPPSWVSFLEASARLYKYSFPDQLMIYAQKPNATACADYVLWNNRMGRYIRRGAKGIALLDVEGDYPKLRYVFDVSDTGGRPNSRPVRLWAYRPEHFDAVSHALETAYGTAATNMAVKLEEAAKQLASEFWTDHQNEILGIVADSFLEEYDDFNIGSAFRSAAAVSIAYALQSRCGLDPQRYFSRDEFRPVLEFNTPETITALGTAVSEGTERVLRQIERAIQDYERSKEYERNDLPSEWGLSNPRPSPDRDEREETPGQVRENAESLPEGEPPDSLEPADSEREAVPPSPGDRRDGEPEVGADDGDPDAPGGDHGAPQIQRPDPVDGQDERPKGTGGGTSFEGTDFQLTLFPTESEQIQHIDGAEREVSRSAFSVPQEVVDDFLRTGSNRDNSRMRILTAFSQDKPLTEREDFLRLEYQGGYGLATNHGNFAVWYAEDGLHVAEGNAARYANPVQVISWKDAADRIEELLEAGQFANNVELAEAGHHERTEVAQSLLYLRQDFSEEAGRYLPILDDYRSGGFPEATERLSEALQDPEIRRNLLQQSIVFHLSYQENPRLLRFSFHKTEEIVNRLKALDVPRRTFSGEMAEIPPATPFITEDEIQAALARGSGMEGGRGRIADFFSGDHTREEKAEFLKNEYGTGGRSHALSGATYSDEDHSSKGIRFRKKDCPTVELRWPEVVRRIDTLIAQERYPIPERQTPDNGAFFLPFNAIKEQHPEDMVLFQVGNFFELYGEDAVAAAPLLQLEVGPRTIPDIGTVRRCRIPAEELDRHVEILRETYGVTISPNPKEGEERESYSLPRLESPGIAEESPEAASPPVQEDVPTERTEPKPSAQNFRITDDHLGEGGPKAKFRANLDAIELLKQLEAENRNATPEEQEILSRYVGWGGLSDAFDVEKPAWAEEFKALQSALTPEEYAAARASTLNAHYTSPTVIRAMYSAIENMGFSRGNILEPSMGVGNFFGMLPDSLSESRLYGVELDSISGRIAQKLYPNAEITVAGFETTDRKDFYDLAIGNVPFGQYQVNDRAYNKLGFSIHNYFFAKALDQVRPGGVVAFVTSRFTMDAKDDTPRKYIAQRAELLGAIRLPNNAFRANAGTDVVSDILFLQKRETPLDRMPDWVQLGENTDGFSINRYFLTNPEMVLGEQTSASTPYGRQEFTVEPMEGASLGELLSKAVTHIEGQYREVDLSDLGAEVDRSISLPADPDVKNFSYTVVDGEVYFRENSVMVQAELNATAKERIKGLVSLRDCTHELIALQVEEASSPEAIQGKQEELNRRYDAFSARFGLINDRANRLAFSEDSSYYLLCSLEILDDDQKLKRKADMFTKRTIRQARSVTSVDTASEALSVSIGERAKVDLAYMADLTGKSEETLISDLQGVIFRDPLKEEWQTADEYLSGNVRRKLRIAEQAAADDPAFLSNVEALTAAQPKDLDASEIEVRLGATWIHKYYIQQFMQETFDMPWYLDRKIQVNYVPYTAEWQITGKSLISHDNVAAYTTFGTSRANAYRILEDSLNLRDVRIYDTVEDADGKERRVLNAKETTLAAQKQQLIRDAFRDWIWEDPERRAALVKQYNEEMNAIRPREYDGRHLVFSGMNPEIQLREHQKNAIAHVIYGGNTLLAHEVGAGKTFEMVAAAMESKRLGLCTKSLIVVPNHLTEQWASEFLRLYPSANLLVTTKKDFEPHNRKKFCARIATGDYDAVIIGHSQFEKIPISQERQARLIEAQIDEITDGIREVRDSGGERFTIKQLEKTKRSLEIRLEKLSAEQKKDDVVTFEQLGVDRIFVDESDNYKNLFLYTKMRNVAGLSTSDAQKSSDMFSKCRYLDELTGNRGVIFATGTPISNSMTEMYTIQRYLQYDRLQEMGMAHFDCWASRFGETATALELAPEGTGYRARTRFSKFFNLPELMNLFKEVADIKTADQLHLPTPEVEYQTYASKPTEEQQAMVQELSRRATLVHNGTVDAREDNMLKITSDGRKLGLDQRILNPLLPDKEDTKVNQCVGNVLRLWEEGEADKTTQLIFCDLSTPKADDSFTVYSDIRQKLISSGMPPEQVAFIHEANTEVKKKELFAKVRSGQVRVLIGSTAKMGAGTNVQDRLIAIHDLDCPWRPRDLTQRKGRIERQGNQNEKVYVCRYVTESTFDAYLWQTVENKQKFISQIMTSKSPVRSCEDVDETALSFAEIKALCAGDPRIKERMDLEVEVSKLKMLKADHQSKHYRLEDQLLKHFPEQIEATRGFIAGFQQDEKALAEHPHPEEGFAGMVVRGDTLTDKDNAGAAILEACKEIKTSKLTEIGSYRGLSLYLSLENFQYHLTLKGGMRYEVELGKDAKGNLVRLENAIAKLPDRLRAVENELSNLQQQKAAAEEELKKPFPFETELKEKSARLVELDSELNLGSPGQPEQVAAKQERPSVLEKLKQPLPLRPAEKHKIEQEAR